MPPLRPFVKQLPAGRTALAVRVASDADAETVAAALNLPAPHALLILSGGAGQTADAMLRRLTSLFDAIGAALARQGVTVIDGGTQSGVMALMGQALDRSGHTAPYIGVLPAHAPISDDQRGEDILEPHHSHFVLIEADRWGDECDLMGRLAGRLSERVPSLLLLVNGGEVALQDLAWNVHQGREIVVLAGSGRLADEIAAAVCQPEAVARPEVARVAREGRVTLCDLAEPAAGLVALIESRLAVY